MLVCELLEWQEDFRFDRPACRSRVPLKRWSHWWRSHKHKQKKKKKQATDFFPPFLIAVYLLILSMVVFNSGTLSLRGWTPSLPPLQTPVPKRKNIFVFLKKILILMHLLLLFSLIYFHLFHFICYFVIILWVFILFFLPYCYYIIIFYGCIKCIYVSWPWVTPLLSWARSALKESGGLVWDKPSKNKSTEWPNVI